MAVIQERRTSDGKIKYRVLIRMKGCPPQSATFDRKTDARKWAQDTESAIRDGRYFKTIEAKKHTFGDMVDRYVKEVLPHKPKMEKQQKTQLTWWKAQLGHFMLSDVTPARIGECRDRLLNEEIAESRSRTPATVVRYLAAISHMFSTAVNEWGWLDQSPVSKVRRPTEPRGRVRFLSDDERELLLTACKESDNSNLYLIVVLAISTGMRQGEILKLKWQDIDFDRAQLVLHDTKNNERRVVPVVNLAHQVLKEHGKVRQLDNDYVFPREAASGPSIMRTAWLSVVAKAKLKDFKFHDLRHTAASYFAMNGASLAEIAEILGHKTLAMVQRYAHLSEAHTAGVVARMNEKIFGELN